MDVDLALPRGKAQHQFLLAPDPYVALISGYGLGKTTILLYKLLLLAQENVGCTGLIVAHSYEQLTQNIIPKYKAILDTCGIPYGEVKSEHRINLPWGPVLFRTAEKPIVGFDCGYAGVDEACLCRDDAFKDVLARVRDKKAKRPQICFTSTPEGKSGWIYNNLVKNPLPGSRVIYGSTMENKKNLAPGYIEALTAAYDEKLAQAYLHGAFIDFNGSAVYHQFHEQKTVTATWPVELVYGNYELMRVIPQEELIASFDFGNAVSTCVVLQKSMVNRQLCVRVLDEIWLRDSNTWECVDELVKRYGGKGLRLRVHGDATGQAIRGSAATQTDYDIIRKTCTGSFSSLSIDIPSANSAVVDRVNCVNSALKGSPAFQLRIAPACKRLIADLNEVRYVDDGSRRLDKKSDPLLTHVSDALGYAIQQMPTPLQDFHQIRAWS